MILTLKSLLKYADAKEIAIGSFNITCLENLQAVLSAAEELGQPVIVQFAPAAHESIIPLKTIGPIMVMMAENSTVPVCVHLDHCTELSTISDAIDIGFTSVMYDGSTLPFKENVAETCMTVELAHSRGVSVEAEIGATGREESESTGTSDDQSCESTYTDPADAERFVKETGIDAVACSFGTVHGLYVKKPNLDFERIKDIRNKVKIPIVMHGGSGISDKDFRHCIKNGVRKINYFTYLSKAGGDYVKEKCAAAEGNVYFHDVSCWGIKAMKENVLHTMKVFSDTEDF